MALTDQELKDLFDGPLKPESMTNDQERAYVRERVLLEIFLELREILKAIRGRLST